MRRRSEPGRLVRTRQELDRGLLRAHHVPGNRGRAAVVVQVPEAAFDRRDIDAELHGVGDGVRTLLVVEEPERRVPLRARRPQRWHEVLRVPARVGRRGELIVEGLVGHRRHDVLPTTSRRVRDPPHLDEVSLRGTGARAVRVTELVSLGKNEARYLSVVVVLHTLLEERRIVRPQSLGQHTLDDVGPPRRPRPCPGPGLSRSWR